MNPLSFCGKSVLALSLVCQSNHLGHACCVVGTSVVADTESGRLVAVRLTIVGSLSLEAESCVD